MSTSNSSEQTAATVEAAIRQALEELGAHEDDVIIEVLSTPRSGVLGLGARQARVRVTRRPPEAATSTAQSPPPASSAGRSQPPRRPPPRRDVPQRREEPPPASASAEGQQPQLQSRPREERRQRDERPRPPREARPPRSAEAVEGEGAAADARRSQDRAEQTREATEILGKILELMGEKTDIREGEHDPESIELEIKGDGSGLLIGRHGQTLDALEYIVNRVLAHRVKEASTIVLDTESYRARRRQQIHRMALSMGEQAKREHATVKLEPMPPRERRIVHLALKDDPLITTRSEGEGYLRSIEIAPVGGGAPREGRSRERGRGREPERGHEPREPAIGEQGGFKHGQKRII
jgi:spoIIIJ-associated protein